MSIKRYIKKKLYSTESGKVLFFKLRIVREKIAGLQSDKECVSKLYKQRFGHDIDLKKPITYQEKLQWLKLFYRDDRMPVCTDKAELHNYLRSIGFDTLSNDIIGIYENAKDIDFESLPDKFVAKANHGSGWNLICEDKNKLNWHDEVKLMNAWLKLDLSVFGREWNYKSIKPKIVVEKYIEHQPLNDYKYMCFNGEPLYMQLNNDHDGSHFVDFYKIDGWEHLPCTYGPYMFSEDREIEKPRQHEKMMEIARQISKPFPFVRVDFYNFDDVILIGELTFFPGGGLWPFTPREVGRYWDKKLGEYLTLPEANFNLNLLNRITAKSLHKVGGGK